MITNLKIENFRVLNKVDLEIKPLTIIVGENGTGKSSVLKALSFLKQSCGAFPNESFNGYYVNLGSFDDVTFGDKQSFSLTVNFSLTDQERKFLLERFSKTMEDEPRIPTIKPNKEIGVNLRIEKDGLYGASLFIDRKQAFSDSPKDLLLIARKFPNFGLAKRSEKEYNLSNTHEYISALIEILQKKFSFLYPFSPFRGGIKRRKLPEMRQGRLTRSLDQLMDEERRFREDPKEWVGERGECTLEVLAKIFGTVKYEPVKKDIIEAAKDFGIANLHGGSFTEVSADYRDQSTNLPVNLADAGFGSKQILPILVQLFWGDPGSCLMIEEPEISLHIKYQRKLMNYFAKAVKNDKQIIVTTHSEHLPLALHSVVPDIISNDEVAVYHFEKGEEGITQEAIQELPVSEQGSIEGWIPSYVEAEKEIMKKVK